MLLNDNLKSYINRSLNNLNISLNNFILSIHYRKIDLKFMNGYEKFMDYGVISHIFKKLTNLTYSNNSIESIVLVENNSKYEIYMLKKKNNTYYLTDKGMKILQVSDDYPRNNYTKSKVHKRKLDEIETHSFSQNLNKYRKLDRHNNISIKIDKKKPEKRKSENNENDIYEQLLNLTDQEMENLMNKISSDNKLRFKKEILINHVTENVTTEKDNIIESSDQSKINTNVLTDIPRSKRVKKSIKRYSDEFY